MEIHAIIRQSRQFRQKLTRVVVLAENKIKNYSNSTPHVKVWWLFLNPQIELLGMKTTLEVEKSHR